MMQDDSSQKSLISELPVRLYDSMFPPLDLFIKSQCEHEPDQN